MTGLHPATASGVNTPSVAVVGVAARELAEVQAKISTARDNPRDVAKARQDLLASCARPGFAEKAVWTIKRGGQDISGPSVHLAREAALRWGNVAHRVEVVEQTEFEVLVEARVTDLETNTSVAKSVRFGKRVPQRGGGDRPVRDEQELLELINKNGAKALRNAIFEVVPPDIIEEALEVAKQALAGGSHRASNHADAPLHERVGQLIQAYERIGISQAALEFHFGCTVGAFGEPHYVFFKSAWAVAKDHGDAAEQHLKAQFPEPSAGKGEEIEASSGGAGSGGNPASELDPEPEGDLSSKLREATAEGEREAARS